MTPLGRTLLRQIRATGPLSVAEYMAACLFHPELGYYATRDPLGLAGDFTTAPEISQMFGELIGLALAQAWLDRGAPNPVALVELGPGRGTLMADALRATRSVPGFHAAARLHLMEASPILWERQAEHLGDHAPVWIETMATLPSMPALIVANELFDALPIRQFLRDGDLWRERLITETDGELGFALSQATRIAALEARLTDSEPGDMVEMAGAATALATEIGTHLSSHGGTALIIDYGAERSRGDTLQAVRRHRKESPLASPGEADLTAHVDFGALAGAAPCETVGPVPQGVWLERLGITARARVLARNLTGEEFDAHKAAHRRLTHPDEMGQLFKVLALHDGSGPPPGLEPLV